MVYLCEMQSESGLISADLASEKGKELHDSFRSATPYPHAVIDNFLPDEILNRVLEEFPGDNTLANDSYNRAQERLKVSFHPDKMPEFSRVLFYSFNSRPFIRIIENITGIRGLIPDPYFLGAGFHQISQGGHLSVHADFNHHKPMNLERRVNVLIYLNKGWREDFGGAFELWDKDMTCCANSILPEFNRCVIFNTTAESMHGNPQPINHPDRVPRRSIALYYYTATWDSDMLESTTQFRVRPNSKDAVDWQVKLREVAKDLAPPMLTRGVGLLKRHVAAKPANHQ